MPLPTLEKSWTFDVNKATPAGGSIAEANKRVAHAIVSAIAGFSTAPWTVRGSSNSVTAGMDGVNRIAGWSDWATGASDTAARSWIVFRQPLTGMDLLIEARSPTTTNPDRNWRVAISPGGLYTGGTITARPTATDEVLISSATGDVFANGTQATHAIHVMQSTDGTQLRVIVNSNGTIVGLLIVGTVSDPIAGLSGNFVGVTAQAGTWSVHGAQAPWRGMVSGVLGSCYFGSLGWGSLYAPSAAQTGQIPQADGTWLIVGGAFVSVTANAQGVYGRPVDLWYGPSTRPVGSTYPADGSATFAQFDQLVVPWNGTIPTVA